MNSLGRFSGRIRGQKGFGGVWAQRTLHVCVKLSKDKLKRGTNIVKCCRDICKNQ